MSICNRKWNGKTLCSLRERESFLSDFFLHLFPDYNCNKSPQRHVTNKPNVTAMNLLSCVLFGYCFCFVFVFVLVVVVFVVLRYFFTRLNLCILDQELFLVLGLVKNFWFLIFYLTHLYTSKIKMGISKSSAKQRSVVVSFSISLFKM